MSHYFLLTALLLRFFPGMFNFLTNLMAQPVTITSPIITFFITSPIIRPTEDEEGLILMCVDVLQGNQLDVIKNCTSVLSGCIRTVL